MKSARTLSALVILSISMTASADLNITADYADIGGGVFTINIYGELTDPSDGLALFGFNMTCDQNIDLGAYLDLDAPAAVASFDRNDGLTNPPGPANSGFGGTPSGATLIQIGGGQNTLGNTAPPVYPVGSVVEGICQSGPQLLATGTMDILAIYELTGECPTLTIDGCFANMLDANQSGPVYSVSPVMVVNGTVLPIIGCGIEDPANPVSVFSMANHGTAGDLGIQIYPVPLVFGQPYNTESRFGLTQNILEIELDKAISDASGVTITATDSDSNLYTATVALDPAGDVLVATFSPVLPDQKIYTIDVSGGALADFQFEYVTLIGNVVNIGGMHIVNTTDRVILNTKLGQAADVAGPQNDIFRIGDSNGVIDTTDRVILNTKLGNQAN